MMLQILNGKKISAVNSLTIYQCLTNTEFTSAAKSDEGTTSPMMRLSGRYPRRSSHSCEQTAEDEVGLSYALLYYDITWQIGNLLYNSHFRILYSLLLRSPRRCTVGTYATLLYRLCW